jgi:hypothetical protein
LINSLAYALANKDMSVFFKFGVFAF